MPKSAAADKPKPTSKPATKPSFDAAAALQEPAPAPVAPGTISLPGAAADISGVTSGIGPSPARVARFSARTLIYVIIGIIVTLLALAGIILPSLPASKIPPTTQTSNP